MSGPSTSGSGSCLGRLDVGLEGRAVPVCDNCARQSGAPVNNSKQHLTRVGPAPGGVEKASGPSSCVLTLLNSSPNFILLQSQAPQRTVTGDGHGKEGGGSGSEMGSGSILVTVLAPVSDRSRRWGQPVVSQGVKQRWLAHHKTKFTLMWACVAQHDVSLRLMRWGPCGFVG